MALQSESCMRDLPRELHMKAIRFLTIVAVRRAVPEKVHRHDSSLGAQPLIQYLDVIVMRVDVRHDLQEVVPHLFPYGHVDEHGGVGQSLPFCRIRFQYGFHAVHHLAPDYARYPVVSHQYHINIIRTLFNLMVSLRFVTVYLVARRQPCPSANVYI